MSTPRKRLGNVAREHLLAAETALIDAQNAARTAAEKRRKADQVLAQLGDGDALLDTIKRYPGLVERALLVYGKIEAEARQLDAEAGQAREEARRFIIAATYAHKEEG